jgi:acetylornithine deacetylase
LELVAMKPEVEILRQLIAIPSVSSMSNVPVIEYALKHLDRQIWKTRLYRYRDAGKTPKFNLVARTHPRQKGPVELALVCHTDTVPFDPAWKEAVSAQIRAGRLYGRGACDVKGFLACVLASLRALDLTRLSKPLALVLTADEEIGCVGAKYLARRRAFSARYMIIGEPTGLRPVRAGKGYAVAEIIVRGREAHSAFPAQGRSAIFDAARVVARLEQIAAQLARRRNAAFDPAFTTLNAGLIQGGTAKNIIPGECRILVEWRPIPGQDPDWPARLIRAALKELEAHGVHADLEVKRLDPAFSSIGSTRLVELLESTTRRKAATVAFGTEAAHLQPLTTEVVVFGPGDMTTAHKTGEHVRTVELNECVLYLTV